MRIIVVLVAFLLLCGSVYAVTASAETNVFSITAETLPVVLSSFSASVISNGFISLRWVTESETELLGYRVYRSDSGVLSSAIHLSTQIIPATNTSTTQSYSFTDSEVAADNTYYYWLEILEYSQSQYHGPVSIRVEETISPELPLITGFGAIYPNPFRQGTLAQFEVQVKDNDPTNVSIYNIRGQRIKQYQLKAGSHRLYWDGKDSSGKPCGSGIYLLKLSSGSINQTTKLMLIK